jgi:hypothetical protein
VTQFNFSIRVRVPNIDSDRLSAQITQRKAKVILRNCFKAAMRDGSLDVTMWDLNGTCTAHYSADPQPYRKQTLTSCFNNPLGR